jgi:hypothetical protein
VFDARAGPVEQPLRERRDPGPVAPLAVVAVPPRRHRSRLVEDVDRPRHLDESLAVEGVAHEFDDALVVVFQVVRAVVVGDPVPVVRPGPGRRAPADDVRLLEHRDGRAAVRERPRGGGARRARADDADVCHVDLSGRGGEKEADRADDPVRVCSTAWRDHGIRYRLSNA